MWVEALHAGLGLPTASSIVLLSFFTSLVSAAFGLGGGAVLLAVLANLLPAAAIIPVHGVVQVGSNLGRAAVLFTHIDRTVLVPFARSPAFLRHSGALVGLFSSFLTMFFGGTGPFIAAYIKTLGHDRLRHVATHASLMTLQHVLKSLAFGVLGFAFADWLPLVAMMILAGFLGTVAGKAVLTRIDERRFRLALNALLVVLALRLIGTGVIGLANGM